MNDDTRREFERLAAREPIPLAHGALLIAKDEYPELDLVKYIDQIEALAREAEPALRAAESTVEKIQSLSEFLFTRKGFEGNREQYADPRNSYLNQVLERRLGIPISLSVLYIEVGRRLGLKLYGVSFPTHFLVKAVDDRGELIIDPFNDGTILDLDEIRARLKQIYRQEVDVHPEMLKPVGARQILTRMLRNLKNIHARGADWQRVLSALDRILMLDPRSLEELLERGVLYQRMECFGAALEDFQSFLTQAPEHPAAETVREAVIRLTQQVSRLN